MWVDHDDEDDIPPGGRVVRHTELGDYFDTDVEEVLDKNGNVVRSRRSEHDPWKSVRNEA